jgi:hypothetical protein
MPGAVPGIATPTRRACYMDDISDGAPVNMSSKQLHRPVRCMDDSPKDARGVIRQGSARCMRFLRHGLAERRISPGTGVRSALAVSKGAADMGQVDRCHLWAMMSL